MGCRPPDLLSGMRRLREAARLGGLRPPRNAGVSWHAVRAAQATRGLRSRARTDGPSPMRPVASSALSSASRTSETAFGPGGRRPPRRTTRPAHRSSGPPSRRWPSRTRWRRSPGRGPRAGCRRSRAGASTPCPSGPCRAVDGSSGSGSATASRALRVRCGWSRQACHHTGESRIGKWTRWNSKSEWSSMGAPRIHTRDGGSLGAPRMHSAGPPRCAAPVEGPAPAPLRETCAAWAARRASGSREPPGRRRETAQVTGAGAAVPPQ